MRTALKIFFLRNGSVSYTHLDVYKRQEQKRASYMARMNYGLMDKYLLTVTGRWDGASMLSLIHISIIQVS